RLTSKTGWIRVQGTFTAKGREQYMIIGNFNTDAQSDTTRVAPSTPLFPYPSSYYFIDDVSVTAINPPSTGVAGPAAFENVAVYPHPARDRAVFQFANPQAESL